MLSVYFSVDLLKNPLSAYKWMTVIWALVLWCCMLTAASCLWL